MRALTVKLWRDLWHLRGQLTAITVVIAAGVAVYILSVTTYHTLELSRDSYYRDYRFADVFVSIKRAPDSVLQQVAAIPGVAEAEGRVVAPLRLEIANFDQPVDGLAVSIPDDGPPRLNRLHVSAGRLPADSREVMLSEAFASAHRLAPGDELAAIINGRREVLRVVGLGLSPEHIYQLAPGAMLPDFLRFGVLWMAREPLARAYDMDGAFNDVALALSPGANQGQVIAALDQLLARYGGLGAYGREDQLSNRFLREEFRQLEAMAFLFPVIFLSVAVFLLNIVLQRLVATQRENIAALKAFGYTDRQVAWHYLQWVLVITAAGLVVGVALGAWLGHGLAGVYDQFYRFPRLLFELQPGNVVLIALVTGGAAVLACLRAVLAASRLPPAQAMQPPAPRHYRRTLLERLGAGRFISPPMRMVWRHLERRPLRSVFSVAGIAAATSILMVGNFQSDAIHYMMHVQFHVTQRDDLRISLTEPVAAGAAQALRGEAGVDFVEVMRTVPARLRHGQYHYLTSVQGLAQARALLQVVDTDMNSLPIPPGGVMLTEQLAEILHVGVGDTITVESLEGKRKRFDIPVTAISRQFMGVSATMERSALNRALGEGDAINVVLVKVEPGAEDAVFRALKEMPRIAGVSLSRAQLQSFNDTFARNLVTFTLINLMLGGVIAFGVVYNLARIALAERGRELASLRVLGYSRREVSYILLAELAIFSLAGIVPGLWLGRRLCYIMAEAIKSELYYVPVVLERSTYAGAAATILLAALFAAWVLWRRIGSLDLVAVLKTRE